MGDSYKQKVAIVVAYGIISMVIFFISIAIYVNSLIDQTDTYSKQTAHYIESIMDLATVRNKNAISYAILDDFYYRPVEEIYSDQTQDDYLTTICEEIKSIVPNVKSVLLIMENGDIYSSDDIFSSYIEQFKSITNSEFYKDTCVGNTFSANKYNKYYNVECYSYSNSIFDYNANKIGTFVVTYDLNWVWNELNSLNKEDINGTIIFETFDKKVLSIIDKNGIERYEDNDLIGDKAYEIIDKSQSMHKITDWDRQLNIYFVANTNYLLKSFNIIRAIAICVAFLVLITIIILTKRRKDKYLFEISTITLTAIVLAIGVWHAYNKSYIEISKMTYKLNQYNDNKIYEQNQVSFKRGVEAYTDIIQTSMLKDVDTGLTAKEFANYFGNIILEKGMMEFQRIRKAFLLENNMEIFIDDSRKVNLGQKQILNLTEEEKEIWNRINKSGGNELSIIEHDDKATWKTLYFKARLLAKYSVVFSIKYDTRLFCYTNTYNRYNTDAIAETYFIDYNDGYKIALIRASEISEINDLSTTKYVEADENIFNGNIKKIIESEKDYECFDAISSNGNFNKAVCINNKDLKILEVYFLKEAKILECRNMMIAIVLIEALLFGTVFLYYILEIRRQKIKDTKEEIMLHGNY